MSNVRLFFFFLTAFAVDLAGQPAPGTITTHAFTVYGPSVIDRTGAVYSTNSYIGAADGPVTPGAAQTQPGGGLCAQVTIRLGVAPCSDAHIVKYDPDGNVVFGTLLGGTNEEAGVAIAIDSAQNVYIAGITNPGLTAGSLPTTPNAAIQSSTTSTVFAAKLSADGSRFLYVTYLPDILATALSISVDAQGNAFIAGQTSSRHAYVVKISTDGSSIAFTKLLAGSNQETATAAVADRAGNVIVAGHTSSPDFPVTSNAAQMNLAGAQNVFVSKIDPSGNVVSSTFFGGSSADDANAIQTDAAGNIYIAGATTSLDLPVTHGSFQPSAMVPMWNLGPGGFLAKLAPDASAILYSTYVPASDGSDFPVSPGVSTLSVTPSGDAYIAGTAGAGFPVTRSAPQACFGGSSDVFVAHLDSQGALRDSTYFGGLTDDTAWSSAIGSDGSVLLVSHNSGPRAFARIRFGDPGWTAPPCLSADPLNSATLRGTGPGAQSVAPGEFVTLTGVGIGPDAGVAYQPDAQGSTPRSLAGVQVFFDGQAAPVLYAQSGVVNVQAPFELSGKPTTSITLQYNDATFGPITTAVNPVAPGVFRMQPGLSSQALILNEDGTLNSPSNPAALGSVVAMWGTGFGPTATACSTGGLNVAFAVNLASGFSAQILKFSAQTFNGNVIMPDYACSAPEQLCGVVQINFRLPDSLPGGWSTFLFSSLAVSSSSPAGGNGGYATINVK
jgi:uncharacterized protein (TIGR03437 family)